ncbi:MAG: MopE-related protein [Myxococcota bacterium]
MRPSLWLLALIACKQDVTLSQIDARLVVPTPLVDVSAIVGEDVPFVVELQHFRGERAEVLGIDVVNVQGTAFAYTGEEGLSLVANEVLELPFVYSPSEAGFDVAALYITTNAVDGSFEVTARGRAAVPELDVFPAAVDFGPVAPGAPSSVQIRLDNPGTEPVELTGRVSDTRFAVVAALPLSVPAGGFVTMPITYTPVDLTTVTATLTLSIGAQDIADVQLRANDCANGNPTLYDVDRDGVTGCAGDCDDTDEDRGPGVPEVLNGIDDDCDGSVDEGTSVTDDDGDGYCEAACTDGSMPGDCNDADAATSPAATEVNANGRDDDCDGTVDLGAVDVDADGVAPPLDCDDARADVRPGAPELIDGRDNDCDGAVDEGTTASDDDGDGYCEDLSCAGGALPGDCDDGSSIVSPVAPELPDWIDNDCDGTIDEGTVNEDADGDGFTTAGGDCDDTNAAINPALGGC